MGPTVHSHSNTCFTMFHHLRHTFWCILGAIRLCWCAINTNKTQPVHIRFLHRFAYVRNRLATWTESQQILSHVASPKARFCCCFPSNLSMTVLRYLDQMFERSQPINKTMSSFTEVINATEIWDCKKLHVLSENDNIQLSRKLIFRPCLPQTL